MKDFLHLINIEVDDVYAEMLFQVTPSEFCKGSVMGEVDQGCRGQLFDEIVIGIYLFKQTVMFYLKRSS